MCVKRLPLSGFALAAHKHCDCRNERTPVFEIPLLQTHAKSQNQEHNSHVQLKKRKKKEIIEEKRLFTN